MNQLITVVAAYHRLLIRLYPRSFRDEFGAEMEAVFLEQLADSAVHSPISLFQLCWRELRDWPLLCLQAHWQARQQTLLFTSPEQTLSWWDAAIPGIPYFLLALILSASTLFYLSGQVPGLFFTVIMVYGFVFILLLVMMIAWWRGWPDWSASWIGFLFFVLLMLYLPGQLSDIVDWGSQMEPLNLLAIELGLPLLWLAVLYVLLYRWPRAGLVAVLPTFGMAWLFYLEFVPQTISTVILSISWIWLGVVAMVLLRWRRTTWDIWLIYLAAVVTGMIYVIAGHFLTEIKVRDDSLQVVVGDLVNNLLPALIPLVGIMLLHRLRIWSQANGKMAVAAYRLMMAASLLMVISVQATLFMLRRSDLKTWPANLSSWLSVTMVIGLLLMLASMGLALKNRWRWSFANNWPLWLLYGLLLTLPLFYNVGRLPFEINQAAFEQFGFDNNVLIQLETIVYWLRQGGVAAGIVWLLIAALVIGRMSGQLPSKETVKAVDDAVSDSSSSAPAPSDRSSRLSSRSLLILVIGLVALVVLMLPLRTLAELFQSGQRNPFDIQIAFPILVLLLIGLIIASPLLGSGLRLLRTKSRKRALLITGLSLLLIVLSLHRYYWLIVWDSTYDGFGFLWLFIILPGVFIAALLLASTLPGWAKVTAPIYLLLIAASFLLITWISQGVGFEQLTEDRAVKVSEGLAAYYTDHGQFPEELGALTPSYLPRLSEPAIIFGQDWCYDSSSTGYQFGFVYHEHWSDPRLVGLNYSTSSSDLNQLPPLCEKEIAALQARAPEYYGLDLGYARFLTLGEDP